MKQKVIWYSPFEYAHPRKKPPHNVIFKPIIVTIEKKVIVVSKVSEVET